jgi:hypothetical protein
LERSLDFRRVDVRVDANSLAPLEVDDLHAVIEIGVPERGRHDIFEPTFDARANESAAILSPIREAEGTGGLRLGTFFSISIDDLASERAADRVEQLCSALPGG